MRKAIFACLMLLSALAVYGQNAKPIMTPDFKDYRQQVLVTVRVMQVLDPAVLDESSMKIRNELALVKEGKIEELARIESTEKSGEIGNIRFKSTSSPDKKGGGGQAFDNQLIVRPVVDKDKYTILLGIKCRLIVPTKGLDLEFDKTVKIYDQESDCQWLTNVPTAKTKKPNDYSGIYLAISAALVNPDGAPIREFDKTKQGIVIPINR